MPFDIVGIQNNLPVQPDHVLQIIQSLTWTGTYGDTDFFRRGRTSFGLNTFVSNAHVEMHDYQGLDPLVVYGGPVQALKVDTSGNTTISNLTAAAASITGSLKGNADTATTASYALNSAANTTPGGNNGELQYNNAGAFAGTSTIKYDGATLRATGSFTGSFVGTLAGAATTATNATNAATASYVQTAQSALTASYIVTAQTASYINIKAGPGITINNSAITASVRSVNGNFPNANGNITTALSAVVTGTSASFDLSGSGDVTASLADGLIFIIANDPTPSWNGDTYIFNSGSVGQWYPIAPLDQAATDALYLRLDGTNAPMAGDVDFGGFSITNALNFEGTSSWATTSSYALTASYLEGGSVDTTAFITTGSDGLTQGITGSINITGSELLVEGNIRAAGTNTTGIISGYSVRGTYYPWNSPVIWNQNINNNISHANFPYIKFEPQGNASEGFGPLTIYSYFGNMRLGYQFYNDLGVESAQAVEIIADNVDSNNTLNTEGYAKSVFRTLVSDNINMAKSSRATAYVANGRRHTLTVTGSFLARDGVSMGTDLTNEHYLTGSLRATGSATVAGVLAVKPYSGSFSGLYPQYVSTDTQQVPAGVLTAQGSATLSGSYADRYLPQGYQLYDVYFNENFNGENTLRLWAPNSTTTKHKGPITIVGQFNSTRTALSASYYNFGTIGSDEWITLYFNSVNNFWHVQSRGRKGETVLSSGKTDALQTFTGSLGVSGNVITTGSIKMEATSSFILPTTASASPTTGQVYFDFNVNKLYAYNGSAWVTASLG